MGIQAGLANGIPLLLFTMADRQEDGLVAILGAFTALYFARFSMIDRVRTMPFIAAGFSLAAAIGTFTSGAVWSTMIALIVVGAIACLAAFSLGIGPPGPMMFVLVVGVSGHITAPPHLGGGDADPLRTTLLVTLGAFSAYLIVIAPLALPFVRRRQGPPTPFPMLLSFSPFDHTSKVIVSRVLLAVTAASLFSIPLGVPRAYWVIMTAGVVLQTGHTLRTPTMRAVQRVIGTLVGVAIFGLLSLTEPSGLQVIIIVAVLQFLVETVIVRNYGLGLMFITPVALTISTSVGNVDAPTIIELRVGDTILGAIIALVVLYGIEWLRTRQGDVPANA